MKGKKLLPKFSFSEWLFICMALFQVFFEIFYVDGLKMNRYILMIFLWLTFFLRNALIPDKLQKIFTPLLPVVILFFQSRYTKLIFRPHRGQVFGVRIPLLFMFIILGTLLLFMFLKGREDFKVRSLMIVSTFSILIVGGYLYNHSFYIPNFQIRKHVNLRVKGDISLEEKAKKIQKFSPESFITDLRDIHKLPNIHDLSIIYPTINDDDVSKLRKLQRIYLLKETKDILDKVSNCSTLENLNLEDVAPEDIPYFPKVRYLDISSTSINNGDFTKNIPSLKYLEISYMEVNDTRGLLKNKNLVELIHFNCEFDDDLDILSDHGIKVLQ